MLFVIFYLSFCYAYIFFNTVVSHVTLYQRAHTHTLTENKEKIVFTEFELAANFELKATHTDSFNYQLYFMPPVCVCVCVFACLSVWI